VKWRQHARKAGWILLEDGLIASDDKREGGAKVPWYALQVRPRYEKLVSRVLQHKGVEQYLPLYRVKHRWSDRLSEVDLPLFPGYVFCQLDWSRRVLPVLTTPGVLRVLGVGRVPVPLDDSEFEAIRAIMKSGIAPHPWPMPRVGDRVCIEQGPLRGLEGILVASKKQSRLLVSVTLLQRAVAVEIERAWARPIKAQRRHFTGTLPMSLS
jgi:transcription antitermination factor NusG